VGCITSETLVRLFPLITHAQRAADLSTDLASLLCSILVLRGNPDQIFVLNADICSAFPLKEMRDFHLTVRGRRPRVRFRSIAKPFSHFPGFAL
jgi:hypothetical protein